MHKTILTLITVLIITVGLCAAPVPAEKSAKASRVLAQAGSEKVTADELQAGVAEAERAQNRELSVEERQGLLKSMVNQRLMVAEAKSRGLDKDAQVKAQVAEGTRRVLANTLYDREIAAKAQVAPAEVEAFYKANPQAFERVTLSQIVVKPGEGPDAEAKAEARAKALAKKASKDPAKFADLAKAETDDPLGKNRGGDLGEVQPGALLPELEQAAFAAKPGAVLGPVRSKVAFHVLNIRGRRTLGFDESRELIAQELFRQKAGKLQADFLAKLAKKHKVTLKSETAQ
jgi:peptidylprolyl isomerase